MKENFISAMVLAGVGDAMGFKCGEWEFCFVGMEIHKQLIKLGGVRKLAVKKPDFIVSDDTVLLLATAEAIIENGGSDFNKLFSEIAFRYKNDFIKDMQGRSGGMTTANACHLLKPSQKDGWCIPFNPKGGGCGAAMRSMCIGLRYPNVFDVTCLEKLITVSIESGRMTHNHPTGFLGSFVSALFGALSIVKYPIHKWGFILLSLLPKVFTYIELSGRDVVENKNNWDYFQCKWKEYLTKRNLLNGDTQPQFPVIYGVKERDAFYKSLSFCGWGGASGHDAPMIAYDALLSAKEDWEVLCHHGMLHGGDNDSTGVIAGFCYGSMYTYNRVPLCNYADVEYKKRLIKAGEKLFQLAEKDSYLLFDNQAHIPVEKLFL